MSRAQGACACNIVTPAEALFSPTSRRGVGEGVSSFLEVNVAAESRTADFLLLLIARGMGV